MVQDDCSISFHSRTINFINVGFYDGVDSAELANNLHNYSSVLYLGFLVIIDIEANY